MSAQPKRAIHYLKCWPEHFDQTVKGLKPFEVRKNDRDYRVGDQVVMYEWDPKEAKGREAEGYSGREVRGNITCILDGSSFKGSLGDGYVVLGVEWTDGIYPKASA